jgi:hypothetical protein
MFRSFDHHQVAYSSILSQVFSLTAIAVSWISNHATGNITTVTTISDYYCIPPDDGRMTETRCGKNIVRGGEEELLH